MLPVMPAHAVIASSKTNRTETMQRKPSRICTPPLLLIFGIDPRPRLREGASPDQAPFRPAKKTAD
jgi:hypothetical protein